MGSLPAPMAEISHAARDEIIGMAFQELRSIIVNNFDERIWFMTEACLSVITSLALRDLPNPIGLNLVDGPSTEKTTVLGFFYGLGDLIYRTDDFTPASFVSHAANVKKADLSKIDLLPKIQHRCLIVPELAPLFGADRDKLLAQFSILTRVFDGEGLLRDSGVHGGRGYTGDYRFCWLGATTPIKPHVWKLMGQLGSRFLFLTVESKADHDSQVADAIEGVLSDTAYVDRVRECREAVTGYVNTLLRCLTDVPADVEVQPGLLYASVQWNRRKDNRAVVEKIAQLANLTACTRSTITTWKDKDEIDFTIPIREGPARLTSILYGLARGHAIAAGRRSLSEDDLPIIVAVALSSVPDNRRRVLQFIIDPDHPDRTSDRGSVTSTEIEEILGFSRPTARKTIKTLEVLGVGTCEKGFGSAPLTFTLKDYFGWLLTDDFLKYHQSWRRLAADTAKTSGKTTGDAPF